MSVDTLSARPVRWRAMIVYQHDKAGFCRDVETGGIDRILLDRVSGALGIGVSASEVPVLASCVSAVIVIHRS